MKALKFELSGKNAFFKNPEVNTYYYFTYGNIHKPALLGIFGAILGYQGYAQKYEEFPEYYQKLKDIRLSIIPKSEKGNFSKKIQYFNNSVGYASLEQGGNLVVKEEWLENPAWIIYVLLENEESRKLAEMMMERKCAYIPYLGKNDHPAVISEVSVVDLTEKMDQEVLINCLIPEEEAVFDWFDATFKYAEFLPIELDAETNHYKLKKFIFTDAVAEECKNVYSDGQYHIVFY